MGIYIEKFEIPEDGFIDVRIHSDGTATMPTGTNPYYEEVKAINVNGSPNKLIDREYIGSAIVNLPVRYIQSEKDKATYDIVVDICEVVDIIGTHHQ